jgi:hypothetical protein
VTLLERVVAALDERDVPCALIGAAALAAAGVARSTYDFDLLTTDGAVLHGGFWSELRELGVDVEVRRGDDLDPLAGVVRLDLADERPVDVVVGRHGWQARAVQRAIRTTGGPPVVTRADLVLLKLFAGGTQDLWDIRQLLATPSGHTIIPEVEEALKTMPQPMRDAWTEVRR